MIKTYAFILVIEMIGLDHHIIIPKKTEGICKRDAEMVLFTNKKVTHADCVPVNKTPTEIVCENSACGDT